MSEPTIEKGIPIPAPHRQWSIWSEMAVGDSVLLPDGRQSNISARAQMWGRRNGGAKFTTRKTREGVRVWRVS